MTKVVAHVFCMTKGIYRMSAGMTEGGICFICRFVAGMTELCVDSRLLSRYALRLSFGRRNDEMLVICPVCMLEFIKIVSCFKFLLDCRAGFINLQWQSGRTNYKLSGFAVRV
jgi:hypothetical protein